VTGKEREMEGVSQKAQVLEKVPEREVPEKTEVFRKV
jgi:hypothetical protein